MTQPAPRHQTPRQRIQEVLANGKSDQVPVSVWLHNFLREQEPADLIAETLRLQEKFDFDFLKPQSPAHSACLLWGAEVSAPTRADDWPTLTKYVVESDSDLDAIKAVPVTGMLADQIEVMRGVIKAVGPDVPVVATVFSPMMTLGLMHADGPEGALGLMQSNPRALTRALDNISRTLEDFTKQAIDAGVDGVFYASNSCNKGQIDRAQHDEFHAPYDGRILKACAGGWMNILHLCGPAVQADFFSDYDVQIFSWDQTDTNPSAAEMHRLTGKTVMTGAPSKPVFGGATPQDLHAQVRATIDEMDGAHLIIGPGCSINPGVDEDLITAVVQATRETAGRTA